MYNFLCAEGASVMKVKVAVRTPKLHYVYPPCFEAGKPMDLLACGSNLLQPKFRYDETFCVLFLYIGVLLSILVFAYESSQ